MICIRCCKQELFVGHSCTDDSAPCSVCGRSRVVEVVLHDDRGFLSITHKCIGCLGPNQNKSGW